VTAGGGGSSAAAPLRRYPSAPVVGVGAVIVMSGGAVVLVRRAHEPLAGRWSLPGGALELGETLRAAVAREVLEETGLLVDVGAVVDAVDHIAADVAGRTEYHFVIVDYLCQPIGGELRAGGDVDSVALADPRGLDAYALTAPAQSVIRRGVELYTAQGRHA
jgi:ADP-ribose pyrophosphatase YjhB (NUDIX family)